MPGTSVLRLLLDSHTLVWFARGDTRCSPAVREAIDVSGAEVFVSAATAWEIATKVRLGKWPDAAAFAANLALGLARLRFRPLPIAVSHACRADMLPGAHRDPFDRMLAAQALIEELTVATADPAFALFEVPTLW